MDGYTRLVTVFIVSSLVLCKTASVPFEYHNFADLESFLVNISQTYPNITYLYSIGKSVQNRDLWVIALGELPRNHESLRPELKYVGNMHGNEVVGRELLIHLIEYIAYNYGKNDTITQMLQRSRVHILVTMNPDGFEEALTETGDGTCTGIVGRFNANGLNLNRNFPDYFEANTDAQQIETTSIIDWLKRIQFVLSANLHGGALVVNYPFDNYQKVDENSPDYSATVDDDIFRHISKVYSYAHTTMHLGTPCDGSNTSFPDGITNGVEWYSVVGGMQDYNYMYAGCMEVTLELSCCKFPLASTLQDFWEQNRDALVRYLQLGYTMGVKGIVRSAETNDVIPQATIQVLGREFDGAPKTTSLGEYWRILLPGSYQLKITALGFKTTTQSITVEAGQVTVQHIVLEKSDAGCGYTASVSLFLLFFTVISSLCSSSFQRL